MVTFRDSYLNKIKTLLSDELDENFPYDLDKEFWKAMEKIAILWNNGLRDEVIKILQNEGYCIEWFKWGYSSGFPVLVLKLAITPESTKCWEIADQLAEKIKTNIEVGVACLIHP